MQFLMQRQSKVIKKEVKLQKILYKTNTYKWL